MAAPPARHEPAAARAAAARSARKRRGAAATASSPAICSTRCTPWRRRRGTCAALLGGCATQGATQIGVYGLSLGGYNTALLASLDASLACAIAGIPATDFARLYYRHLPAAARPRMPQRHGCSSSALREVLRVVSPLALEPRVPHERRYIFGGTADRLVPADQVRDLWRHWEQPRIAWYPGATSPSACTRACEKLVHTALVESGLSS